MINQENLFEFFDIDEDSSFCPASQPLGDIKGWNYEHRIYDGVRAFSSHAGTEYQNEIMKSDEAFEKVYASGYTVSSFTLKASQLLKRRYSCMSKKGIMRFMIMHPKHFFDLLKKMRLPYPIFGGYSDIFFVHKKDMKELARYFGIFAAMRLFVELAVPTAMKISCENLQEIKGRAKVVWSTDEVQQIERNYDKNIEKLFLNWPKECNYMHPIKLSKWV